MQNYTQTQQTSRTSAQQEESFMLSTKPQKAMQEMMETIDDLRQVYVRETEALNAADAQGFMDMQDEKLVAARKYQSGISQILERKDEMKSVDPELRQKLEKMQGEFSELAKENLEALDRMRRTMDTLGTTLRNAVADAARQDRTFAYTAAGRVNAEEAKTISTGSISESV